MGNVMATYFSTIPAGYRVGDYYLQWSMDDGRTWDIGPAIARSQMQAKKAFFLKVAELKATNPRRRKMRVELTYITKPNRVGGTRGTRMTCTDGWLSWRQNRPDNHLYYDQQHFCAVVRNSPYGIPNVKASYFQLP
jgi:hypothetical protein